jgi:aspartate aminotransferase
MVTPPISIAPERVLPLRRTIAELPSSKIREVAALGMGKPGVIPLWFGEPDLPTPDFINRAASQALEAGHTFYTMNRGVPALREALAAYLGRLYARPIGVDRITVTASAMNALAILMQSLIDPGDNAVLTTPLWPNIAATVQIMGGEARAVPLAEGDAGWRLDLDRLFDSVDGCTRALFINSPNNPTGWMIEREEQQAVLEFCRARGIWILADEVYDRIVYDRPRAPSFLDIADSGDLVVGVNSFSKSWAMTGWRMGWLVAPDSFGPVLEKMNEYNIAGAPSMAQHAGIAALGQGESFVAESVARYRRSRDLVSERLTAIPRVGYVRPNAAFYAFFSVDGVSDSLAFAKDLLLRTGVGLAPGIAFGPAGEGHLRLCFASAPETLSRAMDRLEEALADGVAA